MILAVACYLFLFLNCPYARKNKENPAWCPAGVGSFSPSLSQSHKEKSGFGLGPIQNQQHPRCHFQKCCCWSKTEETQSLGRSDRENWGGQNKHVLAGCGAECLAYYTHVTGNQRGNYCCTSTEQKCNSFTFSSTRNVLSCLLGSSSTLSYAALMVHLKFLQVK